MIERGKPPPPPPYYFPGRKQAKSDFEKGGGEKTSFKISSSSCQPTKKPSPTRIVTRIEFLLSNGLFPSPRQYMYTCKIFLLFVCCCKIRMFLPPFLLSIFCIASSPFLDVVGSGSQQKEKGLAGDGLSRGGGRGQTRGN